jgi:hypothetical protein
MSIEGGAKADKLLGSRRVWSSAVAMQRGYKSLKLPRSIVVVNGVAESLPFCGPGNSEGNTSPCSR